MGGILNFGESQLMSDLHHVCTKMKIFLVSACAVTLSINNTEGRFVFPDDPVFQNKLDNDNSTTTVTTENKMINVYPDDTINEISDEKSYKEDQSYPTAKIIAMLHNSSSESRLNSYFEKPNLGLRVAKVPEDSSKGRSQIIDEWVNLCHETTTYQYPRLAKNKAGVSRFVVNSDGDDELSQYRQKVKMTRCDGSNGDNIDDDEYVLGNGGVCETFDNLVTRCKQEYSDHKLVAVDDEGRELIVDIFRFPSGCTCVHNQSFLV